MENASKALIIAGAILLSIAIIGIGMSIFKQASDTINKSNMTETEMAQFNAKFESYEGNRKGSNVKQLITAIMTNNAAEDGTTERKVSVTTAKTTTGATIAEADKKDDSTTLTTVRKSLKASTSYEIDLTYENGLIVNVKITE